MTFEKFSFHCAEKDKKELEPYLSSINLNQPKASLNIAELWKEADRISMMKTTSFMKDKKALERAGVF
jgi:hypothetical protein